MFSAQKITKSYASPVLTGVDLTLAAGEVHALVGANGAGKSTLARILAGLSSPDGGEMSLHGSAYVPVSRRASRERGVSIVLQELHLVETLSVAENLFLHELPSRGGWIRRAALRDRAVERLSRVGLGAEMSDRPLGQLGVGQRQLVAIARALDDGCRLLILDEPTAALTEYQTARLFEEIQRFRDRGVAILYISHRLEELRRIADRVTVLRDGGVTHRAEIESVTSEALVQAMSTEDALVGSEAHSPHHRRSEDSDIGLAVTNLSSNHVHSVSFEARSGEILGIFGLVGAGRTELLRAIFGADRRRGGTVQIAGARLSGASPQTCVRSGMVMLPEDRKLEGLLLSRDLMENTVLGLPTGKVRGVGGAAYLRALANPLEVAETALSFRRRDEEREKTELLVEKFSVRCDRLDQPVNELSGGNQQKLLVGRQDLHHARVLLLDEPTRGIDVAARRTIHGSIRDWAADGKTVLVVSSELMELMELCHRIGVVASGRWVQTFDRDLWTESEILAAALGFDESPEVPVG